MVDAVVGEKVTVGAVFGSGSRIRPAWFHFGGRKIRIEKIHYSWTERQGRATLHHFSVSDGSDVYHLVFSSEDLAWHLETVSLTT
jgi:hypothetical protein